MRRSNQETWLGPKAGSQKPASHSETRGKEVIEKYPLTGDLDRVKRLVWTRVRGLKSPTEMKRVSTLVLMDHPPLAAFYSNKHLTARINAVVIGRSHVVDRSGTNHIL